MEVPLNPQVKLLAGDLRAQASASCFRWFLRGIRVLLGDVRLFGSQLGGLFEAMNGEPQARVDINCNRLRPPSGFPDVLRLDGDSLTTKQRYRFSPMATGGLD